MTERVDLTEAKQLRVGAMHLLSLLCIGLLAVGVVIIVTGSVQEIPDYVLAGAALLGAGLFVGVMRLMLSGVREILFRLHASDQVR